VSECPAPHLGAHERAVTESRYREPLPHLGAHGSRGVPEILAQLHAEVLLQPVPRESRYREPSQRAVTESRYSGWRVSGFVALLRHGGGVLRWSRSVSPAACQVVNSGKGWRVAGPYCAMKVLSVSMRWWNSVLVSSPCTMICVRVPTMYA
jgi:hypothetical protein